MKKLYWRPQKISLRLLWLVALVSVAGLVFAETFYVREKQPYYKEKIQAARLASEAFQVIKQFRKRMRHSIDAEFDLSLSGLIGDFMTGVTTNRGHLPAKQTSINPNFAAVAVHLLMKIGVEPGDKIAIGFSGSFPAINICVLAAADVLKLDPIVISGVGSSQWGANLPRFTWPTMEKLLFDKKVLPFRSVALSRGGIDDRALGLPKEGRKELDRIIERSGLPALMVNNYDESVKTRMELYSQYSAGQEIKAYVNVGGGTSSVGTKVGKRIFKPGLNRTVPRDAVDIDSVMTNFGHENIPVIHFSRIDVIAERYGLPLQPVSIPPVGEGKVFYKDVRSNILVSLVLAIIIVLLVLFLRLDWGYRLLNSAQRERLSSQPERMV